MASECAERFGRSNISKLAAADAAQLCSLLEGAKLWQQLSLASCTRERLLALLLQQEAVWVAAVRLASYVTHDTGDTADAVEAAAASYGLLGDVPCWRRPLPLATQDIAGLPGFSRADMGPALLEAKASSCSIGGGSVEKQRWMILTPHANAEMLVQHLQQWKQPRAVRFVYLLCQLSDQTQNYLTSAAGLELPPAEHYWNLLLPDAEA